MDVCARRKLAGITLLEILIALAISGMLLVAGLPSYRAWLASTATGSLERQYLGLLALGRETAVLQRSMVSLCGSRSGESCDGHWEAGAVLFVDRDADANLDAEDEVLRVISGQADRVSVRWKSFRNKPYLQLTSLGFTNNQSGNFTFCPMGLDSGAGRQLIVNTTGRARWAKDLDGDGLVEDAEGRPLRCDAG
jgi:type IV fimbrial biogenesis protein FimT